MNLSDRVFISVLSIPGRRAGEIAVELGVSRKEVNHVLYMELKAKTRRDESYQWWPTAFDPQDDELSIIHRRLLAALGPHLKHPPAVGIPSERPFDLQIGPPLYMKARFYVFRLKHAPANGSRSYINLTIGDTSGRKLTNFDDSDGFRPVLMGFDLVEDVFVLFDAGVYEMEGGFRYNRFCSIDESLPIRAVGAGIARETRTLRKPAMSEVVIACRTDTLMQALEERRRLTVERIVSL